jgi:hypothetical protein
LFGDTVKAVDDWWSKWQYLVYVVVIIVIILIAALIYRALRG